jgi:hypothetical protein
VSAQILKKDGKPEWAVLPYDECRKLLEAAEVAEDVVVYRAAQAMPEEELVPADVVNRILDGESVVTVWREHRGMTQTALAKAAGLSTAYVSQIEAGKRVGTVTAGLPRPSMSDSMSWPRLQVVVIGSAIRRDGPRNVVRWPPTS